MKPLGLHLSVLAALLCCSAITAMSAPFTFSSTGNLAQGRTLHTTTLLQNGKVLVAGGANPGILGAADSTIVDRNLGGHGQPGNSARGAHCDNAAKRLGTYHRRDGRQ